MILYKVAAYGGDPDKGVVRLERQNDSSMDNMPQSYDKVRELSGRLQAWVEEAYEILQEERVHLNKITNGGKLFSEDVASVYQESWEQSLRSLEFINTLAKLIQAGNIDDWKMAEKEGIARTSFGSEESKQLWTGEDYGDTEDKPLEEDNKEEQGSGIIPDESVDTPPEGIPHSGHPLYDEETKMRIAEAGEWIWELAKIDDLKDLYGIIGNAKDTAVNLRSSLDSAETDFTQASLEEIHRAEKLQFPNALALYSFLISSQSSYSDMDLNYYIDVIDKANQFTKASIEQIKKGQKDVVNTARRWRSFYTKIKQGAGDLHTHLKNIKELLTETKKRNAPPEERAASISQIMMRLAKVNVQDKIEEVYKDFLDETDQQVQLQKAFSIYAQRIARAVKTMHKLSLEAMKEAQNSPSNTQDDMKVISQTVDGLRWMASLASHMGKRGAEAHSSWESIKKNGLKMMSDEEVAKIIDDAADDPLITEEELVDVIMNKSIENVEESAGDDVSLDEAKEVPARDEPETASDKEELLNDIRDKIEDKATEDTPSEEVVDDTGQGSLDLLNEEALMSEIDQWKDRFLNPEKLLTDLSDHVTKDRLEAALIRAVNHIISTRGKDGVESVFQNLSMWPEKWDSMKNFVSSYYYDDGVVSRAQSEAKRIASYLEDEVREYSESKYGEEDLADTPIRQPSEIKREDISVDNGEFYSKHPESSPAKQAQWLGLLAEPTPRKLLEAMVSTPVNENNLIPAIISRELDDRATGAFNASDPAAIKRFIEAINMGRFSVYGKLKEQLSDRLESLYNRGRSSDNKGLPAVIRETSEFIRRLKELLEAIENNPELAELLDVPAQHQVPEEERAQLSELAEAQPQPSPDEQGQIPRAEERNQLAPGNQVQEEQVGGEGAPSRSRANMEAVNIGKSKLANIKSGLLSRIPDTQKPGIISIKQYIDSLMTNLATSSSSSRLWIRFADVPIPATGGGVTWSQIANMETSQDPVISGFARILKKRISDRSSSDAIYPETSIGQPKNASEINSIVSQDVSELQSLAQ